MKRFFYVLSTVLRLAIMLMYPSFDPCETDEFLFIMITRNREWKTFSLRTSAFYNIFYYSSCLLIPCILPSSYHHHHHHHHRHVFFLLTIMAYFAAMVSDDVRSNVLDEFTTCVELSFSLLSNAKPNLRQLSAVVILCIMKSAVSPLCPEFYSPLKDLLSDMLQKVFDECMEKRNNRITLKFFEDCLVRCPEFTIRTLLSRLVRGTVGGKTPYLRSECCRLISMIVKKKESQFEEKNLSDFIIKECFHLAKNIGDALSSSSTETGTSRKDSDNRTKRIKPILLCIKDLSILLKSQKTSKTANKRDSTQKATKELVDAVHVAVSLNSNLKQLADQIFANLGQNPSADERKDGNSDMDVNKSGDNRESNKNDNGSNKRKNSLSEVESMRNWGLEDKSDENMKKKSKRSKKTHS